MTGSEPIPPPFPCPVKTWRNNTYSSISPTRPELSCKGRRIIITGGGTGIGRATALAFAAAGASSIFLLGGRREEPLRETKKLLNKQAADLEVNLHALDTADVSAVQKAAIAICSFDVLVLNAAYLPNHANLLDADLEDLTLGWNTNIIGNINILRSLLPNRNVGASVLNVSTGLVSLDPQMLGGKALITATKMMLVKMLEVLTVEVPDCFFVSFHPGAIDTDMFRKSSLKGKVPEDDISLPAHFAVWLASTEARFLRGRFVWASWDVEELKKLGKGLERSPKFTSNILGWPFTSDKLPN